MRACIAAVLSCVLLMSFTARAAEPVPTLQSVVGHALGEEITSPANIVRYFEALAAARPKHMKLVEYGKSWEGRPLVYAILTSSENMDALGSIQRDMQRLAVAAISKAEAADVMEDLPAPVWLSYSVHGNEISPSDAAMQVAYTLLSKPDDPEVKAILDNVIVILDPLQNPDGRNRFVHDYYTALGLEPAGSAIAAERKERWPKGRTNHYLFDMNRDWFALTQPETRARVRAFLDWFPVIFVDLHEMGTNETYYFSPEAEPYNPYITQAQRERLLAIGKGNAAAFDKKGYAYFTREEYDAHYPGYGAGWPLFHGSVGTTYEQASARGLIARRDDGSTYTFADSIDGHFTASMATLKTAAEQREMFLKAFFDNRRSAISLGRSDPIKAYVIPTQSDQAGADKLAGTLAYQGVEVRMAETRFTACDTTFEKGSFIVPLDQPAGRLARTLLDRQVNVDPAYMAIQEERRSKGFKVKMSDVTAWSMPLMYNVDVATCGARPAVRSRAIMPRDEWKPRPGKLVGEGDFGFVVPWGNAAAVRVLSHALRKGIDVRSSDLAFSKEGRDYPAGSLVFQASRYDGNLRKALDAIMRETGATGYAIADSWVDRGPNFGSKNAVRHLAPRIALAWDEPTSPYSAGSARFVMERQLGYPVTPVRVSDLGSVYLDAFDVLILPEGKKYENAIPQKTANHIEEWVRGSGVLVTLGSATEFLAKTKAPLSTLVLESRLKAGRTPGANLTSGRLLPNQAAATLAAAPLRPDPDKVLGSLLKATVEQDHWLSAGVKPSVYMLENSKRVFAPLPRDKGVTIARLAGPEDLVGSGYVWEEAVKQLSYKPAVTLEKKGRGFVIAFMQDPTKRAYMDGLNVLLANAVLRAPAHAKKIR